MITIGKSQIRTKQIADGAITYEKLHPQTPFSVLNLKKIGDSRIILNIFVPENTNELDITEKIYDGSYQSVFTLFGNKNGVLTTGTYYDILGISKFKGKGFENYAVWIRNNSDHAPILNPDNNREIVGELYVEEYKKIAMYPYQEEIIRVNQGDNFGFLENIEPTTFDPNNFLGKIICVWNGENDDSDRDIGYIINIENVPSDARKKKIYFKEPSPITYANKFKTIKWILKFRTYDNNGEIVDFVFPENKIIDILFIETTLNIDETPTNSYKFGNFYRQNVINVEGVALNLNWKKPVIVATDENININSAPIIIDNYTPQIKDRILLMGQTNKVENGIWVYNGANQPLYRPEDFNNNDDAEACAVFVQKGQKFANKGFVQINDDVRIGIDEQEWVQFTTGISDINVLAGNGLTTDGNTLNVGRGTGIVVQPDAVSVAFKKQYFIATEGQTEFNLLFNVAEDSEIVGLNGLIQMANEDYIIQPRNKLIFNNPLKEGDRVFIFYLI